MEFEPGSLESTEVKPDESPNPKTILLGEFISWSEANNHSIYLVNDYICEDGRSCFELSMEDDKQFTLFCPSSYPDSNEDNFFVEADQSLHFWCNSLNEFILDSEVSLTLPAVLNKAMALYVTKRSRFLRMSSSDSESDEGELCDEFITIEGEEWDEQISMLRKRWRNKEAQIRAQNNKPKTSDMFEGTVKDHPKQVFSNSAASGILTNDLVAILQSQKTTGISAVAVDDNIYKWSVFLSAFASNSNLGQDLVQLKEKYGYNHIELQLEFTMDLHPFYPPIVKVIRPRLLGAMMMQVSSMDMLKLSHWNAARDMKSVLMEIKEYLGKCARLDINTERNDTTRYPQGAYNHIENHLLCLAWASEIPTRAHVQLPKKEQNVKKPAKKSGTKGTVCKWVRGESKKPKIFPAGTGYSSSLTNNKGWDINAHLAAQKEKDNQIEKVLQKILQELRLNLRSKESCEPDTTYSSFLLPSCSTAFQHGSVKAVAAQENNNGPIDPIDDLFIILEASCLVPFLETKLQVDSFFEISRHRAVYRCIVDILSELAVRPKLVPLLWNLPGQARSLYELVSKVDVGASALLERIGKVSSNGTVPKPGDKQNCNHPLGAIAFFRTEPEEEERLARDFHQMGRAVTEALAKCGYPAVGASTPMEVSPSSSVPDTTAVNGTDEGLSAVYKNALKDLQFLSCDIEVDGPASHHFGSKFKKANMPSSKQLMRIAQEMATLSTSLPLDLGSSIFIRTDDGKCTLLRALIVGPECTPYSSGCFVFDIFIPPLFPAVPPCVHLCTNGLGLVRFNPNLYANGTVCLSLLGTWKGMPGETWNAVASTLLQVLVSIQSLIFVPEPYFNEPGFEKDLGTENGVKLSRQYNLKTMINTINHAMIAHIERPASGFQDVIHAHFRIKGRKILQDIKKFMATNHSSELAKAYENLEACLKRLFLSKQ